MLPPVVTFVNNAHCLIIPDPNDFVVSTPRAVYGTFCTRSFMCAHNPAPAHVVSSHRKRTGNYVNKKKAYQRTHRLYINFQRGSSHRSFRRPVHVRPFMHSKKKSIHAMPNVLRPAWSWFSLYKIFLWTCATQKQDENRDCDTGDIHFWPRVCSQLLPALRVFSHQTIKIK